MNFLAHLLLAEPTPEAWIGAILPDLNRGPTRRLPDLPPAMLAAVEQHRRIDAFTDLHPVVGQSKSRLRNHGRFAGVLVDLAYDHLLAQEWDQWSSQPLDRFVADVHAAFRAHPELMPEPMRGAVQRLVEQNWLLCYGSIDGLRFVLERMSRRLTERFERAVDLAPAADDIARLRAPLRADFRAFWPDLVRHAGAGSRPRP